MSSSSNDIFQSLQARLRSLIAATPAGERLPAEPTLARQLGVSRATLREAMRTFETQGLIRRRQGAGTYVTGQVPVLESGLEMLESIESMARRKELPITVSDLDIRVQPAAAEFAELLEISPETSITRIERIIKTKNKPVAWLLDVLPTAILSPEDLPQTFRGSVLDFLLKRGDILSHSRSDISAIGAPASIAKKLDIQRGDVLLVFNAWLYGQDAHPLAYSQSYFLPGHFKFHVVRRITP